MTRSWSRFRAGGRCLQIAQNVCQKQRRFSVWETSWWRSLCSR
jgi:hypothetical protein